MNSAAPSILNPPPMQRAAFWPYWLFIPILAIAYTGFCFWVALESWGLKGEVKPWWWDAAGMIATPGLFFPPFIGAPLWGGLIGFGLVRFFKWTRHR